jgi:hypothetical protein
MKWKIAVAALTAAAVGSLSACGGEGSDVAGTQPSPSATAQSLDTGEVLLQAREASETADPYTVNDGALVLTGTSDSAEPIGVNGT